MKRGVIARQRNLILKRAALVGSILAGGLLWAYSMIQASGLGAVIEKFGVAAFMR